MGMDIITGKMNSRYEDYTDMHHVMGNEYTKTDEVLAKGRNFISLVGGFITCDSFPKSLELCKLYY